MLVCKEENEYSSHCKDKCTLHLPSKLHLLDACFISKKVDLNLSCSFDKMDPIINTACFTIFAEKHLFCCRQKRHSRKQ